MGLYGAYFGLKNLDPSGKTCIRCECRGHMGNLTATGNKWTETDCRSSADNCCEKACNDLQPIHRNDGFSGRWEICTGAPDEPGDSEAEIEVVCAIITAIDILNFPSGESVAINFAVRQWFKSGAKACAKKVSKEEAKCLAIYNAYKFLNCKKCTQTMTIPEIDASIACFSAEVAGRLAYLDSRCDYVLPGSILVGSKTAERGHREQFGIKSAGLANCVAIRASK